MLWRWDLCLKLGVELVKSRQQVRVGLARLWDARPLHISFAERKIWLLCIQYWCHLIFQYLRYSYASAAGVLSLLC